MITILNNIWEAVELNIDTALLASVIVRSILGIFVGVVLTMALWVVTWLYFQNTAFDPSVFITIQGVLIGMSASAGAILAWWVVERPTRVHLIYAAIIIVIAISSTLLTIEIRGVDTHNALFGASQRVPVISLRSMLFPMIFAAVFSGNAAAAVFHIYRALRYREE